MSLKDATTESEKKLFPQLILLLWSQKFLNAEFLMIT
jgi:hypothetical protein